MKQLVLAVIAASPLAVPVDAFAAQTEWTEIMPGARLRAISSGGEIEGRALIGLEIELAPGIKTYWRLPGETGLPTELAATSDAGPRDVEMLWPLPEWDLSQGYVDFVYFGTLVLPALVDVAADKALALDIRMGVCSDICVPVAVSLSLPGDTRSDPANALRLKQALNETPIPYEGDDPPLFDIDLNQETGALSLAYDPERIDPMRVFPRLEDRSEPFSAPGIDAVDGRLEFTLLASARDISWRNADLSLTFATSDGPYEIVRKRETR